MRLIFKDESCNHVYCPELEGEVVLYNDDYIGIHMGSFYGVYVPGFTAEYQRRAKLKETEASQEEPEEIPGNLLEARTAPTTIDSAVLAVILKEATVEGAIALRKAGLL